MKKIIKQTLGIDVAQKELVVTFGKLNEDFSLDLFARKTFPNNKKGFIDLQKWTRKIADPSVPVRYVMEATGVYHEAFAYFLDSHAEKTSIVLPSKISHYIRTLEVKTITDQTAADAICQFGLERRLDEWHAPDEKYRQMRQLTRERDQLVAERSMNKNQLHAEETEAFPNKNSIIRFNERIKLIDKQVNQIMVELKTIINEDKELKERVDIICSIPGIGLLTACVILAETNNFDLIRNKKQLTSYAGLDIKEKVSGTSVRGKSCISKRGNKYLRKAMHLPALSSIQHCDRYKGIFARLVSKHGIKMKASTAVQRKLLELSYILVKNNTRFDNNYFENEIKKKGIEENSTPLQSEPCST
jgi:transposase